VNAREGTIALMSRAFVLMGALADLAIAVFLVIVVGWVLDSWHDPRDRWAGPIVTSAWAIAFLLTAGAPVLGFWLHRRNTTVGKVALVVWLPALLLIAITVVGLTLSPP
jgi:hypothetical protein